MNMKHISTEIFEKTQKRLVKTDFLSAFPTLYASYLFNLIECLFFRRKSGNH
jgi:hypothetical protein